ncbi:hydrolase TatD [Pelomyxa schiedti]|nr:hydrolase TatD [Pelomyxa schiedti]
MKERKGLIWRVQLVMQCLGEKSKVSLRLYSAHYQNNEVLTESLSLNPILSPSLFDLMRICRVDRSGAREGKKSLRKNKQQVHDTASKPKHDPSSRPLVSLPPPPLAPLSSSSSSSSSSASQVAPIIDCGARMANRQFAVDFQKFVSRGLASRVQAMVVMNTDFDKQESVIELCKQYEGVIYAAVGVHSDNVKRTNERLAQQQLEQLRDSALTSHVVALFCGLDWTREFATRFGQEKLLEDHFALAKDINLPVLINIAGFGAVERLCELLSEQEELLSQGRIAVHAFAGTTQELEMLLAKGVYISISGAQLCAAPPGVVSEDLTLATSQLPKIPLDHLLLASDAPFGTPQTIPDTFIRDAANEPSNAPYIVKAMAAALNLPEPTVYQTLYDNALKFYHLGDTPDPTLAQETTTESTTASTAIPLTTASAATSTPTATEPENVEEEEEVPEVEPVPSKPVSKKNSSRVSVTQENPDVTSEKNIPPTSKAAKGKKGKRRQERQEEETPHVKDTVPDPKPLPPKTTPSGKVPKGATPPADTPPRKQTSTTNTSRKAKVPPTKAPAPTPTEDSESPSESNSDDNNDNDDDDDNTPPPATSTKPKPTPKAIAKPKPEVSPATEREEVYTCKMCHKTLFLPSDILPHTASSEEQGPRTTAIASDACKMLFINKVEWMSADLLTGVPPEGKVSCPECGAKIGRYSHLNTSSLPCSCRKVAPSVPVFRIGRARVDLLLGSQEQALAAIEREGILNEAEEEETGKPKSRRARKKQQKAKHSGNFSMFRNKTT